MPRMTGEDEVLKALNQLERNAGQKIRKIFRNKVYLDRTRNAKLILLSFVTKRSRSSIIDKTLKQYIEEFEKENGKLEQIAVKLLDIKKGV